MVRFLAHKFVLRTATTTAIRFGFQRERIRMATRKRTGIFDTSQSVKKQKVGIDDASDEDLQSTSMTVCPEHVIKFYSGAKVPMCQLSNFYGTPVTLGDGVFPSSEHLYQSRKCMPEERPHFQEGGKFASWATGQRLLWPASTKQPQGGESKFWTPEQQQQQQNKKKKGDSWKLKGMIGVMAKMAVAPARAKKLGVQRLPLKTWIPMTTYELARSVWIPILHSKFTGNEALKAVLLSTGDSYLLEFDRIAQHNHENGKRGSRWGGLVSKAGVLYGENWMGRLIMEIRSTLRASQ
jgi:predicted NAD-dependent protein-ADP-ribosyltransferase YbiA (DUF1768 family)